MRCNTNQVESHEHLFFQCPETQIFLQIILRLLREAYPNKKRPGNRIETVVLGPEMATGETFPMAQDLMEVFFITVKKLRYIRSLAPYKPGFCPEDYFKTKVQDRITFTYNKHKLEGSNRAFMEVWGSCCDQYGNVNI